jgi:hypothetical protein
LELVQGKEDIFQPNQEKRSLGQTPLFFRSVSNQKREACHTSRLRSIENIIASFPFHFKVLMGVVLFNHALHIQFRQSWKIKLSIPQTR